MTPYYRRLPVQARQDREANGEEKAARRREARAKLAADLAAQATQLVQALGALEAEHEAAYARRRAAAAALDVEVFRLIDERITEAGPAPAAAEATGGRPAEPAVADDPVAEAAQLRATNAALLARLEEAARLHATFARSVPLPAADIPSPTLPAEAAGRQACAVLHGALSQWEAAGGVLTFSWADLKAQSEQVGGAGAGEHVLLLVKPLLGTSWGKLYPNGDPPTGEVVPQQVVRVLLSQLALLRDQYQTDDDMNVQIEQSFAAIKAGSK